MHDQRQERALRTSWWPIFARHKAVRHRESPIGWLDDWRRPAPVHRAEPAPQVAPQIAPKPAPVVPPPPRPVEAKAPPAIAPEPAQAPIEEMPPAAAPPSVAEAEPVFPPVQPPALEEVAEEEIAALAAEEEAGEAAEALAAQEEAFEEQARLETPDIEIAAEPVVEAPPRRESLFSRFRRGLTRSADALSGGIAQIFAARKIDEATLEELEDLLIGADLGVATAGRIAEALRAARLESGASGEDVRSLLAHEVGAVLKPVAVPFAVDATKRPFIVLVVGVNGTGKTTTIGKLAQKLVGEGKSVLLVAGDTFRAAAVEQLKVWGERVDAEVVTRETGADAAGLAFDAIERAKAAHTDVVFIDTAGRLQNKSALMAELEKIIRVIKKIEPDAPHAVVQVLDATTGQNAIGQVEAFQKVAGVTGLIMTKLDGTARGGILVPLTEKFGLPIHAVGVGESAEDLQTFNADLFARALVGLEDAA